MSESRPPSSGRIRAVLSESVHPVDVAVAIGLAALALLGVVGGAPLVGPPAAVTVLLVLLESLPLMARRRYPLGVALVVVTATIIHIATLPTGGDLQAGLGVLVAIYTLGERLDRSTSLGLTALTGAIVAVLFIGRASMPEALQDLIQTELILGVAWLVGDGSRIRRLYTTSLEERSRLVEREREERTRRAILEERERIARELHDIVTHHVSVIVIQAGGGLRALETRPEEARGAFQAIATTGREALTDMRRLIGVLGEGAVQEPMPGLDRLAELLDQVQLAGLAVELSVEGRSRRLDPGLELSAYRIIQEALTNSLKHGGGRAVVTVRYEPHTLEIAIDDERSPGPRPTVEPAHDGRGLVGMRERVSMFRGTFDAHATTTGFSVRAQIPIDEGAPVA